MTSRGHYAVYFRRLVSFRAGDKNLNEDRLYYHSISDYDVAQ